MILSFRKRVALLALLVAVPLSAAEVLEAFHLGWKFATGDHAGAPRPDFDDATWESIDLPHDWAISGPFGGPRENGDTGKLPWRGEGWYRKEFTLPATSDGQRFQLVFDGVMSSPTVYLNGRKVGSWLYGYNSFAIDATDAANFGGANVLAVHADTREHGSRWYPGAGIYRKVTARMVDPVHLPVWGGFVTTPEVADGHATVRVEVANTLANPREVTAEILVSDPSGRTVAEGRGIVTVAGHASATVKLGVSPRKQTFYT